MFCPNCGTELKIPSQKFCINCGIQIPIILKAPQLRTERSQYISTTISMKTPGYKTVPVSWQKQVKEKGPPGPHSKKCLGFALISISIGLFAYYFGSYFIDYIFFRSMFRFNYFNYDEKTVIILLRILLIIFIFLHIFGLTLGILSRKESRKAGDLEPINSVEKVGSVFGIFGIITNAIALVVSIIFVFIIF